MIRYMRGFEKGDFSFDIRFGGWLWFNLHRQTSMSRGCHWWHCAVYTKRLPGNLWTRGKGFYYTVFD